MKKLIAIFTVLIAAPAFAANTPPPGQQYEIITNAGNGEYGSIGNQVRAVISGTADTALPNDGLIQLDAGSAFTETIPAGTFNGETLSVADGAGTAALAPITLSAGAGSTIGGKASLVLSDSFFNIALKWDGSANWIITNYYISNKSITAPSYLLTQGNTFLSTNGTDYLSLF